jgi:hypothetical protein
VKLKSKSRIVEEDLHPQKKQNQEVDKKKTAW